MSTTRRFASLLGLAMACALGFGASVASAAPRGERPPAGSEERPGKGDPERGPDASKPAFPMPAPQFKEKVEDRLERVEDRLERVLDKRDLPPGLEKQIRQDFAEGAAQVRAAANKAAADGTVTRDEAKEVRELARDLRDKAKQKYGAQLRKNKQGRGRRG